MSMDQNAARMRGQVSADAPREPGGGIVRVFRETWAELKKTTWPTVPYATRLTIVVVLVVVFTGAFMGVLDWVLSSVVTRFSLIH